MNHYCPYCCRDIEPEQEGGCDGEDLFIHDDVPHDSDYKFEKLN